MAKPTVSRNCGVFVAIIVCVTGLYYFSFKEESYCDAWKIIHGTSNTFRQNEKLNRPGLLAVRQKSSSPFTDVTLISGSQLEFFNNLYLEREMLPNATECACPTGGSSGMFSRIENVRINKMEGVVKFSVRMYDRENRTISLGGDLVVVWADRKGKVGNGGKITVSGKTLDHGNGTYSASVKMLWSGKTNVHVKLLSKHENLCKRIRSIVLYADTVYALSNPHNVHMTFRLNGSMEKTRCSASDKIYGYEKLCNFTAMNYNMSFYCGHPNVPNMTCEHTNLISRTSSYPLLNSSCFAQNPLTEKLKETLVAQFLLKRARKQKSPKLSPCLNRNPIESWTEEYPTGIGIHGGWKYLHCQHTQLRIADDIRQCLSNKRILIQGDSTVRQYLETLVRYGKFDTRIKQLPNSMAFRSNIHNLEIYWHIHEFPYHCGVNVPSCKADSMNYQITKIANDDTNSTSDIVLLLTYNAHLQDYKPEVFRSRIQGLVNPIKLLKKKKPHAKILFKGPHPVVWSSKWFEVRMVLLYREILFEELRDVLNDVIYLDTFSLAVAYNDNSLHPHGAVLRGQIDQFLAYIC